VEDIPLPKTRVNTLPQPHVFRLSLFHHREVRVSIFPNRKKALEFGARHLRVALKGMGACKSKQGQSSVYRGTVSGGPYTKIASGVASTLYADSTVSSGKTYYYVTTAVGNTGQESTYSNQITAIIPTP